MKPPDGLKQLGLLWLHLDERTTRVNAAYMVEHLAD